MMKRFLLAALVSLGIDGQGPARFEVATIRLHNDCAGMGIEQSSPGRFSLDCVPVREVIRVAYGNVGGPSTARLPDVLGGPSWIDTDR